MDLAPNATLADLRAELQRELPALHEVKLFQGLRKLADDCQVEIELQGVTVTSPDMALAVPVLNPAGTLVGQARLMHAVLTHRRSADVFSTGDVWSMIRNLKAVRETTGSTGTGSPRDLAISTCDRLLQGGLVDEARMGRYCGPLGACQLVQELEGG